MAERFSRDALARYIASSDQPADKLTEEVAALLVDSGKTADLDSLMRDVMEIRARENNVVELTASSAHPLDATIKQQIKNLSLERYPNAQKVIIHEVIDPAIIGGVRLQYANASLDLTIESKLNRLREAIS